MFIKAKLIFKPVSLIRIKNYLLIFNKNVKNPLAIEVFIKLFIFLIYL